MLHLGPIWYHSEPSDVPYSQNLQSKVMLECLQAKMLPQAEGARPIILLCYFAFTKFPKI